MALTVYVGRFETEVGPLYEARTEGIPAVGMGVSRSEAVFRCLAYQFGMLRLVETPA
jgi:hypothetical protein